MDLKQKVKEFIDRHPLGVVAVNIKHRAPHVRSVFIVADEQLNLYFITRSRTKKYEAIKNDHNVAVTITDLHAQQSMTATGPVTEVTADGTIFEAIFKKLSTIKPPGNDSWLPPIIKLQSGEYVIFQIVPDEMQFAEFGDTLKLESAQTFQTVIGDDHEA